MLVPVLVAALLARSVKAQDASSAAPTITNSAECQASYEAYISRQLIPSPTPPQHCDIFQGRGRFDTTRTEPQCASDYDKVTESYEVSRGQITSPPCSAATITGALCQSARDAWQKDAIDFEFIPITFGKFRLARSHGSLNIASTGDGWSWVSTSTLGIASGCTLGCGRCEVTADGTAKLLYWPEPTTTAGQKVDPSAIVTAVTLGTTFTSPTLYVSYPGLHGENACSRVGKDIGATILPIPPTSTLSSMYALLSPCGTVHASPYTTLTAPFTAADLKQPVPYSIYSSQPSCQLALDTGRCNGTCPTSAPYRPILIIPDGVYRSVQPAWAECWHDVHGVQEIPIALKGTTGKLTTTAQATSTSASPSKKTTTLVKSTSASRA